MFLYISILLSIYFGVHNDKLLINDSKVLNLHYSEAPYQGVSFIEEFLGYTQKGTRNFPVSWAMFKEEKKPFWYSKYVVYLYYTQPSSFFLPSKTFRGGRVGQWRPRQRHSQQQNSLCSLTGSPACMYDAIPRIGTSLEFLPPGAFKVGANHTSFLVDVTCVSGIASVSEENQIMCSELFSRAGSSMFHYRKMSIRNTF